MVMLNDLDRYHLVIDVIDRVPTLGSNYAALRQEMVDKRIHAREYTRAHDDDIPEVRDWVWPAGRALRANSSVDATVATGGDNE
jgi:xylulose-5-phosphate/fructose-6-phosphate phosphoketolase